MTKVDDVIAYAGAELGKPYVYGDEGPNSFDCSGLVQWVYSHVGISLPRTAAQQQRATTLIGAPLPGDLVFYGAPAHHVAIYVGGGKQISAPHTGATVRVQPVSSGATYGRVSGLGTTLDSLLPNWTNTGLVGGITDWLTPTRSIVLEGAAVLAGVALVGLGLWRTVGKSAAKKAWSQVEAVL